ncbi:TRAP transporter large permease subunit [Streptomyces sp. NRRL B-3229]|uniref:TRAP transporter large permease subunit n=1 Tax=Streptomyces sp. NRRL B-3229 TaxID=1463836 RepID=UPI0004C17C76|nr:TRAP transporter large permease subunit [Streptomyces sp. NRRL B-3229]
MSAITALAASIAAIIVWNVLLRRNVGEAMIVGFLVTAAFAGGDAPEVAWDGLVTALKEPITFAALAFVFVSTVLSEAGLMQRLVDILSSLLGRFRGGSAYAATASAGLFSTVAHAGPAIAATIGSITIPWMRRSNTDGETAALITAGNAGMGTTFPFGAAFFVLLASPTVSPVLDSSDVVPTMFVAGTWMVVMRLAITLVIVRRRGITAMSPDDIQPLRRTLGRGWTSMLIFVGIAVPVLATMGPTGHFVEHRIGEAGAEAIDLLIWMPVLVLLAGILVGRKTLPRGSRAWWRLLDTIGPKLSVVGVTMVCAFAASNVLNDLGLADQLGRQLHRLDGAPALLVAVLVGLVVVTVAGPLNSTATTAAVGPVGFLALTTAGVPPVAAFAALLVFASSEGASPPGAAPIYVASGIAEINPVRIFGPIIAYYLVPSLLFGVLIATGVLWVP